MAELADAPDLGSGGEIHAGSIPVTRTSRKATSNTLSINKERILTLALPKIFLVTITQQPSVAPIPIDTLICIDGFSL